MLIRPFALRKKWVYFFNIHADIHNKRVVQFIVSLLKHKVHRRVSRNISPPQYTLKHDYTVTHKNTHSSILPKIRTYINISRKKNNEQKGGGLDKTKMPSIGGRHH